MAANDLKIIAEQEKRLTFDRFDEGRAFELGTAAREIGMTEKLGVAIDIRLWNRPLFFAALPGSQGNNPDWTRRKINTVGRHLKSTYRLVLELKRPDQTFPAEANLPTTDFVLAGGGFPIVVKGAGAIGAIAISGLPQRQDHIMVVRALCAHLGMDEAKFALAAE
ncbi:MAG: heme-degrading domain-containing protein [Rhizobiaceae bacterium]